jgi:hypothetical protein
MKKLENLLRKKDWTLDEAKSMYESFKDLYKSCQNEKAQDELLDVINYFYQLINNEATGTDQFGNVTTRYNVALLK